MSGVVLGDGGVLPAARRAGLAGGHDELPALHGPAAPYGHGRTRSVRGMGGARLTVTPRRARCANCAGTQILLPTELTVRRADSTEVIGNALVAKVNGAGFRAIAERLDRPASTVRSWLRRVPDAHARWLYRRAVDRAATYARELLVRPAPHKTVLGHALNLLAGAALRLRERFGVRIAPWTLIGFFAQGRLLAPPLIN